jgi:hypothetical protein
MALNIARIVFEPSGSNTADILTKRVPGPSMACIISSILYKKESRCSRQVTDVNLHPASVNGPLAGLENKIEKYELE